jgi:hypothetical protein
MERYRNMFPYGLAVGLGFFAVLAVREALRRGRKSTRLREYGFLLFATLVSVLFAVIHDQITATISSEYFLIAKGLKSDPRPYRLAVTALAAKASYWVGLLLGTALLVANNPSRKRPQLGYALLARLTALPLAGAVAGAALLGAIFRLLDFGQRSTAIAIAGPSGAGGFVLVWGIHTGSYLGALVGGITAVAIVVRRRRHRSQAAPVVDAR